MNYKLFVLSLLILPFVLGYNVPHVLSAPTPTPQIRLGILGDSGSDEYRGDDNRAGGTIYEATTLNWMELIAKYRGIEVGLWSDIPRNESRRAGYEYNWARSGATTQALIDVGEHTGLAQQVQDGRVNYVILQIGVNDFSWFDFDYYFNNANHHYSGYFDEIAYGQLTGTGLTNFVNSVSGNIRTATETILSANPNVKMMVVGVNNRSNMPYALNNYTSTQRGRVTDAVDRVNALVHTITQENGIPYLDNDQFTQQLLASLVNGQIYLCGGPGVGVPIDVLGIGDDPHNGVLGDNEHGGTVAEGIIANWYSDTMNTNFGTTIGKFSDYELLHNAGITPPQSCSSPTPTTAPIVSPTPPAASPTPKPNPHFTVSDLHNALQNYLGVNDSSYFPVDGKINTLDSVYVLKNISS